MVVLIVELELIHQQVHQVVRVVQQDVQELVLKQQENVIHAKLDMDIQMELVHNVQQVIIQQVEHQLVKLVLLALIQV